MKKTIFILLLMLFSFPVFSENKYIDTKKVSKDIDSIGAQIDTSKVYAVECWDILKKEYKMWGLKKTIQVNTNVFLPIALFLILFLVWLKNKN